MTFAAFTDADLALFGDIPETYGIQEDSIPNGLFLGPLVGPPTSRYLTGGVVWIRSVQPSTTSPPAARATRHSSPG